MPKPSAWNGVHGPCPPNMKKLEIYNDDAPAKKPLFLPKSQPASIAKKVKGSAEGTACIGILNIAAPPIKPNIKSHSLSFKTCNCFCKACKAVFCFEFNSSFGSAFNSFFFFFLSNNCSSILIYLFDIYAVIHFNFNNGR